MTVKKSDLPALPEGWDWEVSKSNRYYWLHVLSDEVVVHSVPSSNPLKSLFFLNDKEERRVIVAFAKIFPRGGQPIEHLSELTDEAIITTAQRLRGGDVARYLEAVELEKQNKDNVGMIR